MEHRELQAETFLTGYELRTEDLSLVYCPYLAAWTEAKRKIQAVEKKFADRKLELEKQWERV